ncbi:mevalonate kinase [uncultured Microbacterium sp.]|uniref:mevalonate kinase n=1 Tax=uncultured Microbacterium sp. TaxID=191216 RepID=UPI002633D6A3|nr:mevalonate kinase [uncultured Microbacterium sp.]
MPSTAPRLTGDGRSHAKIILFGEHAVVYGAPAVALPMTRLAATVHVRPEASGIHIDSALYSGEAERAPDHLLPVVTAIRAAIRRIAPLTPGLWVRIGSSIPHERGLGSSAAVAGAIARAVASLANRDLDAQDCHRIIQEAERVAHGAPSGLDAYAVVADGPILFRQGQISTLTFAEPLTFVIADSGIPGSTSEAVGDVRRRRNAEPERIDGIMLDLAAGAERAVTAMQTGDARAVGSEMDRAHQGLVDLGVSTPGLNALVDAARAAGALGAKLTGGGLGGCVIALAESEPHAERLETALRHAGAPRTWTLTAGEA